MAETNTDASSYAYSSEAALPFFEEFIVITNQEDTSFYDSNAQSIDVLDIKIFSSPADALYHILTKKETKLSYSALILCDYDLGDFNAAFLLSLLRLHPLGALFPVGVVFYPGNTAFDNDFLKKEQANLSTLGAAFFLIHPFNLGKLLEKANDSLFQYTQELQKYHATLNALEKTTEEKRLAFSSNWKKRVHSFEKSFVRFFYTPAEDADYEEIFLVGKQKYKDRLFNQATHCFERSSSQNSPRKSDSLAYLYGIHKELGNPETGRYYLERAIHAYIETENWDNAAKSAKLFSQDFPEGQNPIFTALQNNFALTNYNTVNKIIESAKAVFPVNEIAEFLLQMNGSKVFPPSIAGYLDTQKELQQIIFKSNIRGIVLDGEAYRKQQEQERKLNYLEQQRLSRINGTGNTLKTAPPPSKNPLQPPARISSRNTTQEAAAAETPPSLKEKLAQPLKESNTQEKKQAGQAKNEDAETPSIESMPTIMLKGGKGSFLEDMLNMAKYTRTLYKKK